MFKKILIGLVFSMVGFTAFAQNEVKEDVDYKIVQPGNFNLKVDGTKPVLIQFFWYGCPHCFKMKPMVDDLLKKYEGKVDVVYYPVAFPKWEPATKMFFTLQNLKMYNKYSDEIFAEIHTKGVPLHASKGAFLEFMANHGESVNQVEKVYDSFAITSKAIQARDVTVAYQIDSAPSYIVVMNGVNYLTNPGMTKSYDKTVKTIDSLLSKSVKK